MFFNLTLVIVSIAAIIFLGCSTSSVNTQQPPYREFDFDKDASFDITCDLNGVHGSDQDRIDATTEIALVRLWIQEVYCDLPEELQKIAERSLFQVNHQQAPATKFFMGWSAEDDDDWKGDNKLSREGGSIKVNLSEQYIQVLHFAYTQVYPRRFECPEAWQSIRERLFLGFAVHELTHEVQYMTHPVRDLRRFGDGCPDGLCDKKLIAENEVKVRYELEALLRHFSYFKTPGNSFAALYEEVVQEHPEWFEEGGAYGLLGKGFKDYYLHVGDYAAQVLATRNFAGQSRATYAAQVELSKRAWDIKELNDDLEMRILSMKSLLTQEAIQELLPKVRQWKSEVESFKALGKRYEKMKEFMPYIERAEERFFNEFQRFRNLCYFQGVDISE